MGICCSSTEAAGGEALKEPSSSAKNDEPPKIDSEARTLKVPKDIGHEDELLDLVSMSNKEFAKVLASNRADVLKKKLSASGVANDPEIMIDVEFPSSTKYLDNNKSVKSRKASVMQTNAYSPQNNSHLGLGPGEMEALPYEAVSPSINLSSANAAKTKTKTKYPPAVHQGVGVSSPSFGSPGILPTKSSNDADKLVNDLIQGSAPLFELALSPINNTTSANSNTHTRTMNFESQSQRCKGKEEDMNMMNAIKKGKEKATRVTKDQEKGGTSKGWNIAQKSVLSDPLPLSISRPASLRDSSSNSSAKQGKWTTTTTATGSSSKPSASFSRLLQPLKRHQIAKNAMNRNSADPSIIATEREREREEKSGAGVAFKSQNQNQKNDNEGNKPKPSWGYSVAASKGGGDLMSRALPKVEKKAVAKILIPQTRTQRDSGKIQMKEKEVSEASSAPQTLVASKSKSKGEKREREREASSPTVTSVTPIPIAAKGLFSSKPQALAQTQTQAQTVSSNSIRKGKAAPPVVVVVKEVIVKKTPSAPPSYPFKEQGEEFQPPTMKIEIDPDKYDNYDKYNHCESEPDSDSESDYEEIEEYEEEEKEKEEHEHTETVELEFFVPPPGPPPAVSSPETRRYSADKAKMSRRVVNLLSPPKPTKVSSETFKGSNNNSNDRGSGRMKGVMVSTVIGNHSNSNNRKGRFETE